MNILDAVLDLDLTQGMQKTISKKPTFQLTCDVMEWNIVLMVLMRLGRTRTVHICRKLPPSAQRIRLYFVVCGLGHGYEHFKYSKLFKEK